MRRSGQRWVKFFRGYAIALFLVAFALCVAFPAFVTEPSLSGEVAIALDRGLSRNSQTNDPSAFAGIQLDLVCDHSTCDPEVWGYAAEFNKADHEGKLLKLSKHGNRTQFQVHMYLNRDKWSEEGEADYFIDLQQRGNKLEGTFSGTHNGRNVEGKALGMIQPLIKAPQDFVPVQSGEHPRLLFRKQDIPVLRAKAQTPMGQQIVADLEVALATRPENELQANDAIAYGLLYHLRGDANSAEQAKEILKQVMEAPITDPHGRPKTLLPAAVAYDLIYDTCNEALREQVNTWLDDNAAILLMGTDRTDFNATPWSNWNGLYRSGLGMVTLTLLGEPGSYPAAPVPPIMMRLDAPKDFIPGEGVPINMLEPAKMPREWLFAGPFKPENGEEPLASIGGIQNAQPEVGTTVTYQDTTHTFQPLDQKYIWNDPKSTGGRDMLDLVNPINRAYNTTSYYYTVVENRQPSWFQVRIRTKYGDAPLYLAGQRLTEGDFVYLGAGRYPMLIEAATQERSGWGEDSGMIAIEPRFMPTTEEDAQTAHIQRQRRYEGTLARWQEGYDTYIASGQANPNARRLSKTAQRSIERFINTALGDWSWNSEGEGYTQWTMDLVLRYAHAYRNVMGTDLARETNLGHFLPLYVAKTIYGNKAYMDTFGAGDKTAGLDLFAEGFSTVTEEYKPAVLWAWNRMAALDEGKADRVNQAMTAAFKLINYPLAIAQKNPVRVLPHVVRDRQKGGYVFRDRWKDENDIVAQVYLKSESHRSAWWYVGDGAFRIYGLGHPWVVKGATDKYQTSERTFENVVLLPDNINGWLGAQTTYFQGQENGSGIVSMNLNDTYLGRKQENGKNLPLADLYGRVLWQNTVNLGIRGMRSFAADYSGASGAPGLFVVVDKLTGGGEKVWQMVIEKEHQLSISGRTFTVEAADGASLKGTFVAPANVKLSPIEHKTFEHRNLRGELVSETVKLNGIQATGGDNFFVVMTLQNGLAPEVQSSGTGLDAKVKVGNQTITFTEDRIVLTLKKNRP